jgi:serine protease Do
MIISFVFLFASCPTLPDRKPDQVRPLDEVLMKNIEDKIGKGMLASAIADISYLERESTEVSKDALSVFFDKALNKLQTIFYEKMNSKEYLDAYNILFSFHNIGRQALIADWSLSRLLVLLAEQSETGGNPYIALTYYLSALSNGELTNPELTHSMDLALGLNNRSALSVLIDEMTRRNIPVDAKYTKAKGLVPSIADLMKGTPIIWIDRGVKIENGMGTADIVLGSGIFINKKGYLLTNYHVIQSEVDPEYEGFSRLYVKLPYNINEKISAKVIGHDRIFDIALLKVEVTPQYVFSGEGQVQFDIGQKVSAIGAPLGLENTITSGILSNVSRRFIQMGNVIQIDAPVNPGNSGGPLVDEKNNLIGIVFAGLEKFEGLNFAIPYNLIAKLIPKLYKGGEVSHSWLGMSLHETDNGIEVDYIVPQEPGYAGGIRAGDILESINGKKYTAIKDAQEAMLEFDINTLVNVTWKHEGATKKGILSASARPFSPIERAIERDSVTNILLPLFGFEIVRVENTIWNTDYVVKKVIQGSIADNSGISIDDTLNVQGWVVDKEVRAAFLRLFINKRKSGYFESFLQLAAYLETENFL